MLAVILVYQRNKFTRTLPYKWYETTKLEIAIIYLFLHIVYTLICFYLLSCIFPKLIVPLLVTKYIETRHIVIHIGCKIFRIKEIMQMHGWNVFGCVDPGNITIYSVVYDLATLIQKLQKNPSILKHNQFHIKGEVS